MAGSKADLHEAWAQKVKKCSSDYETGGKDSSESQNARIQGAGESWLVFETGPAGF